MTNQINNNQEEEQKLYLEKLDRAHKKLRVFAAELVLSESLTPIPIYEESYLEGVFTKIGQIKFFPANEADKNEALEILGTGIDDVKEDTSAVPTVDQLVNSAPKKNRRKKNKHKLHQQPKILSVLGG